MGVYFDCDKWSIVEYKDIKYIKKWFIYPFRILLKSFQQAQVLRKSQTKK